MESYLIPDFREPISTDRCYVDKMFHNLHDMIFIHGRWVAHVNVYEYLDEIKMEMDIEDFRECKLKILKLVNG